MSLFAIGDTHLSFGTDKPMNVFRGWDNYVERLETNWNNLIGDDDTVVIMGDISWAMNFKEMLEDFRFINSLNGQKIILKGNHENILNEDMRQKHGNVPFCKFCDEGNMVRDFLQHAYDDLILHEIYCFENSLPICAAFKNCVVSHAEPATFFSREQIINYHADRSIVTFALTWTANDAAELGTVEHLFNELLPEPSRKSAWYFSGHRPVLGKYALRQEDRLVQIHNPEIEQVAVLLPGRKFDPERDIIDIERK